MLFRSAPRRARLEKRVAFEETLRFPTRLEPAEIHARLAKIRDVAATAGFAELADLLKDIETKPGPEVGKAVIRAIGMVSGKTEHESLSRQLQIVAVNLKNLK